ncbi:hypothetical protein GOODEAATRI_018719 [Goodea atripinnis]|uniref:Uncharacterized protein n=1 Tax=Goodea atripinnis TaxID=208336 RepID=A0ABV0P5Z9_9TELE
MTCIHFREVLKQLHVKYNKSTPIYFYEPIAPSWRDTEEGLLWFMLTAREVTEESTGCKTSSRILVQQAKPIKQCLYRINIKKRIYLDVRMDDCVDQLGLSEQHVERIQELFPRLAGARLSVNLAKCEFSGDG